MSIRHSVKCTKEEATEFRQKVKAFLDAENLPYKSLKVLRSFGGECRIYSGEMTQRSRLRIGRKLIAFKKPDGTIEGIDTEAIEKLREGGDYLYQKTNEPIPIIDYISMYRADDWYDEKEAIKEFLRR